VIVFVFFLLYIGIAANPVNGPPSEDEGVILGCWLGEAELHLIMLL
jgi:hypothetical protein